MLTEFKKTLAVLALEALVHPGSAVESVMELSANEPMGEEDLGAVRDILQPWWSACRDAKAMLDWAARVIPRHGEYLKFQQGSHAHRRLVMLCCMCARTVPGLHEKRLADLDMIESWARGGEDNRDQTLLSTLGVVKGLNPVNVVVRVSCNGIDCAFQVAEFSCIYVDDTIGEAFYEHLSMLADLIRAACPEVPLPEPSGHDVQPTLGSTHASMREVWP